MHGLLSLIVMALVLSIGCGGGTSANPDATTTADAQADAALDAPDTSCFDVDGDTFCDDIDCDDSDASVHPAAAELCNGKDDDCDAGIDEHTAAGSTCGSEVGACQTGIITCTADMVICTGATEPTDEICDDRDNDCDAMTDEGNPGGGASCSTGLLGICADGTEQCAAGTLICRAPEPRTETCNGLDDNCDGAPDDSFACILGTSGSCTTTCGTTGTRTCGASCTYSACAPPVEICNGMDDDCDGSTDEGLDCATADHLVISEVRSRGLGGAADEFVELYNPTAAPIVFDSTWTISARSSTATAFTLRYRGTGTSIPSRGHLLVAGTAFAGTSDGALSVGITDASSVKVAHDEVTVDALCYCFDATTCAIVSGAPYECEGAPFANNPHDNTTATNADAGIERLPGGSAGNSRDTGVNASDFGVLSPSQPQHVGSPLTP